MRWLAVLASWFKREDRCLFRYWDGRKNRAIDPATAWRNLWTHPSIEFAQTITVARDPIKDDGLPFYSREEVYRAEDALWALVREVFGVREWSESQAGLTVRETDALLSEFMDFIADLKKKVNRSSMPSVPTESKEPPPSLDSPDSPDGADVDYLSMLKESNAGAPTGP